MNFNNFGEFILEKRKQNNITVRGLAEALDLSATYVSDVERGLRMPFDMERLSLLVDILNLNEADEILMYDLVGKTRDEVAPDLPDYIKNRDYVSVALRTARDVDAGEEVWLAFIEELKKRKG